MQRLAQDCVQLSTSLPYLFQYHGYANTTDQVQSESSQWYCLYILWVLSTSMSCKYSQVAVRFFLRSQWQVDVVWARIWNGWEWERRPLSYNLEVALSKFNVEWTCFLCTKVMKFIKTVRPKGQMTASAMKLHSLYFDRSRILLWSIFMPAKYTKNYGFSRSLHFLMTQVWRGWGQMLRRAIESFCRTRFDMFVTLKCKSSGYW